jgi:hypothetical protein
LAHIFHLAVPSFDSVGIASGEHSSLSHKAFSLIYEVLPHTLFHA